MNITTLHTLLLEALLYDETKHATYRKSQTLTKMATAIKTHDLSLLTLTKVEISVANARLPFLFHERSPQCRTRTCSFLCEYISTLRYHGLRDYRQQVRSVTSSAIAFNHRWNIRLRAQIVRELESIVRRCDVWKCWVGKLIVSRYAYVKNICCHFSL